MIFSRIVNYWNVRDGDSNISYTIDLDAIKCIEINVTDNFVYNALKVDVYFDIGVRNKYGFSIYLMEDLIKTNSEREDLIAAIHRNLLNLINGKDNYIDISSVVAHSVLHVKGTNLSFNKIFRYMRENEL